MLAAILLAATVAAQPVEVRPATTPIRIDAQLDEPAWSTATPIPVGFEWYPSDNIDAPVRTETLVTYDDRNLYVAFRAYDPRPNEIRARYHERDAAGSDDVVGFYIDPFNDDRRAYQFRANALGVQIDAINSDVEGTEDLLWDAIWDSAGRLTSDGYIVEIAVPLQQLRIPSQQGPQTWGFLAVREWPRDVQHRLRSTRTDQSRDCLVCQFHDLHGFQVAASGRNVEVTPSITGTNEDPFDAGISGRWAVTPGTSLQATLNPDFSQVEADAAQLDVNTRFALFFEEKRPFFVEGSDVFETRMPLVFTRTIADPSAGLKLTGKSGNHLFGALFARDEITNILIPGAESSEVLTIPGGSTTGIARYRGELGDSATIGGLVTTRRGENYDNTVLAADSYYRVTESDSLRAQFAGSTTNGATGHALRTSYNHSDATWSWGADYEDLHPDFRADSGFINQVGVRAASAFAERRVRGGPGRWFRNIFISTGADLTREYDGNWQEWGADIGATYQGPRQSEISINLAPNQEYFGGRTYHNFRHALSASFAASRDVRLGFALNRGEAIDFNGRQQADFVTITPYTQLNLGRRFEGAIEYAYQVFDTKDGERIFAVHLPQARLLYHFSRRAFVRAIAQYERLDRDGTRSSDLFTQFLFSYRVNAQTVFLAGYAEDSTFVKVSYAWLF